MRKVKAIECDGGFCLASLSGDCAVLCDDAGWRNDAKEVRVFGTKRDAELYALEHGLWLHRKLKVNK